MRVEACCTALLKQMLPAIDPQRQGACVDVGVGTFAFYCELFARLGFPTTAVEPLPVPKVRRMCRQHSIALIEACLSDRVGHQSLYLGRLGRFGNANFSSLAPDWFGSSTTTRQVPTLDLMGLIDTLSAPHLSCLKLDVEGWESMIIAQLRSLPRPWLPRLLMFEYGGGGRRQRAGRGWSDKFFSGTLDSLRVLQQRGYGLTITVDYAAGSQVQVFDLQAAELNLEALFPATAIYGNVISFYGCTYPAASIQSICAPYGGGLINWLVGRLVSV